MQQSTCLLKSIPHEAIGKVDKHSFTLLPSPASDLKLLVAGKYIEKMSLMVPLVYFKLTLSTCFQKVIINCGIRYFDNSMGKLLNAIKEYYWPKDRM